MNLECLNTSVQSLQLLVLNSYILLNALNMTWEILLLGRRSLRQIGVRFLLLNLLYHCSAIICGLVHSGRLWRLCRGYRTVILRCRSLVILLSWFLIYLLLLLWLTLRRSWAVLRPIDYAILLRLLWLLRVLRITLGWYLLLLRLLRVVSLLRLSIYILLPKRNSWRSSVTIGLLLGEYCIGWLDLLIELLNSRRRVLINLLVRSSVDSLVIQWLLWLWHILHLSWRSLTTPVTSMSEWLVHLLALI